MVRHITPDQLRARCLEVTHSPAWIVEYAAGHARASHRAEKVETWLRRRRVPHFRMDPALLATHRMDTPPRYVVFTHGGAVQTPVHLSSKTLVHVVRALKHTDGIRLRAPALAGGGGGTTVQQVINELGLSEQQATILKILKRRKVDVKPEQEISPKVEEYVRNALEAYKEYTEVTSNTRKMT